MSKLEELKEIIGSYAQYLVLNDWYRYENGKLIRRSRVGEIVEPDKPVRNAGDYRIYAYHFHSALPYTKYMIADTKTGDVYEIPEIHTQWTPGALKEITDNLIAGKDLTKEAMEKEREEYKNKFNPLDGLL